MTDMKERYGVEELTFEEEMNLWERYPNKAKTRANKIKMIQGIEMVANTMGNMLSVIKSIPELDDADHANRVDNLSEDFCSLAKRICNCYADHAYKH